jgi:DNA-binding transcriptional regulator YiaG
MPDIASVLKAEIARLARKEVRAETESLKKAVVGYRTEIAKLKRRVETLERQQKPTTKTAPKEVDKDNDFRLRFRAAGFAQHRKRLGLSAREMGLLLDASPLSVYKWESGQAKPRFKHLEAIAAVRKMGKREVGKRLEKLAAA